MPKEINIGYETEINLPQSKLSYTERYKKEKLKKKRK